MSYPLVSVIYNSKIIAKLFGGIEIHKVHKINFIGGLEVTFMNILLVILANKKNILWVRKYHHCKSPLYLGENNLNVALLDLNCCIISTRITC